MAATTIASVRKSSVIPGFGLALGVTLTYLSLIVLIPLAGLFWRSASGGLDQFIRIATDPRTLAALRLSFTASFYAAAVNLVFGLILAWMNGYLGAALSLQKGYHAIGLGMWLGAIMWFNVWFIIWPNQKKALGIVQVPAEEKAAAAKTAGMTSRINTMLSIPMLFCMVAQQNAGL